MQKIFIITFFSLFFSWTSHAQRMFDNGKDYDIFYAYTRWGIQIDGLLYFPADYDNPNAYSFQTQTAAGYKFGVVYNWSIDNHFGFRIGALLEQNPALNTYFILPAEETGASTDYEHEKGAQYSSFFKNFSFPILIEYRNFSIDRYVLNLDIGFQIERTGKDIISESVYPYYTTTVYNKGSWDVDLVLKAGWYFQFSRVMMQTNVVYKHRFVDQYEGRYLFTNLASPDLSGNLTQRGDYIGLSFDFFFHKKVREVEMGCRANTQSKEVRKRQKAAEKAKAKAQKQLEKIKKKKEKKMRKKAKKKWIFW